MARLKSWTCLVGMMMVRSVAMLGLISAASCAQSEFIVLKDPATGTVVQCHTDSGASFFPIVQTEIDNSAARSCAAGYEKAGYQRMN
jgi:hypothetical protein